MSTGTQHQTAYFFGLAPAQIAAWVMARVIDFVESGFESGNTARRTCCPLVARFSVSMFG
jgi:hypothetical protein